MNTNQLRLEHTQLPLQHTIFSRKLAVEDFFMSGLHTLMWELARDMSDF